MKLATGLLACVCERERKRETTETLPGFRGSAPDDGDKERERCFCLGSSTTTPPRRITRAPPAELRRDLDVAIDERVDLALDRRVVVTVTS
jgi:hypothetical protein